MSKTFKATVDVEYVMGHLRRGHIKAVLTESEKETYDLLNSDEEKAQYIDEIGELVVDDWSVNDRGPLEVYTLDIEEEL